MSVCVCRSPVHLSHRLADSVADVRIEWATLPLLRGRGGVTGGRRCRVPRSCFRCGTVREIVRNDRTFEVGWGRDFVDCFCARINVDRISETNAGTRLGKDKDDIFTLITLQ